MLVESSPHCGGVAERLKAAVLKTAEGQPSVSSNLTSSAIFCFKSLIIQGFYCPEVTIDTGNHACRHFRRIIRSIVEPDLNLYAASMCFCYSWHIPTIPLWCHTTRRFNSMQHFNTHEVAIERTGNSVLRNTYGLLALTLAFSGLVAYVSQQIRLPHPGMMLTLIGFYGLMFATVRLRNSGWGLVTTFALTGFMGYTLGPILNMYLGMQNGAQVISSAFTITALVFGGLSAFVLITRKDVGFFVLLAAIVASLIFDLSAFQLAISAGFVLFSSAIILYQTSELINGGETNYIMATINLYVSIYNLFLSLLQILGVANSD